MKYTFILSILILSIFKAFSAEMTIIGEYHGKNIYVQNPFSPDKNEYCVKEVFLNNSKTNTIITTSAFEIDLSSLPLKGEVILKFVYSDGCHPKVLNLNAIKTHVKFHFSEFNIDDKNLHWTTSGEKLPGKFVVEKTMHNSWVVIKELESKGGLGANKYSIEEIHHSGSNKYRIKFKEGSEHFHYSKVIEYHSKKSAISFKPKKPKDIIKFSDSTHYEIVDKNGVSLKKGRSNTVIISDLLPGDYFLNLDNRTEKFTKK